MSTRALKKLEEQRSVEIEEKSDSADDADSKTKQQQNLFSLLLMEKEEEDGADDLQISKEEEGGNVDEVKDGALQPKKKRKKRKRRNNKQAAASERDGHQDDIDEILRNFGVEASYQPVVQASEAASTLVTESELFHVDHRCLNPETEMKRIFGSKLQDPELRKLTGGSRVRGRGQTASKLVQPRRNWPALVRTGLSMKCVEELPGGVRLFCFEHGQSYQEAQFLFWDAVESMNPEAFVAILHQHQHHIDTLLQLSEVMRANDDFAASRDLVERALFVCESVFHPLFSVSQFNSRLDYRQAENRPFFLALHRHMTYLCQRGCFRTALEFVKIIYSLDPDNDPLGILLLLDFLALKARNYDYLLDLFHGLHASKNLDQLPNFCYSIALAYFLRETEDEAKETTEASDEALKLALRQFPTLLLPLLDAMGVEPDKDVASCSAFGLQEQLKDSSGLKLLMSLYVARVHHMWKEAPVLAWLERNVRALLPEIAADPEFLKFQNIRRNRYQGTPRNILRHVVLSEVKEAMALLPTPVRESSILSCDPLPPLDSRAAYSRPERSRPLGNDSFLSAFVRSILPNYDPSAAVEAEEEGAVGGRMYGNQLRTSVTNLLHAMRELLDNVEMQPPPVEHMDPEWEDE